MRPHELTAIMAAILASGREPGSITIHAAKLLIDDVENIQKMALMAEASKPQPNSTYRGQPLSDTMQDLVSQVEKCTHGVPLNHGCEICRTQFYVDPRD